MKYAFVFLLAIISLNGAAQFEYYIESEDQTKIFIREFGTGEPIILLGGGPGLNVDGYQPVWEQLSTEFRCIIVDQRGTGRSKVTSVDSVSMSMSNYVNDLEALRKQLKLDKITIVGHSWGAMLAMQYASKQSENVSKMIFIGPGGPTANFYSYFGDNLFMRLHESDISEMEMLDSLNKPTLPAIIPGYFFDRKMGLEFKEVSDPEKIFGQPLVMDYTMPNYFAETKQRIDLLKDFRGIVHIIQGRQDPVGESTVYEIREILPQSQIHFIEKCGHFPWMENEEQRDIFFEILTNSIKEK